MQNSMLIDNDRLIYNSMLIEVVKNFYDIYTILFPFCFLQGWSTDIYFEG